MKKPNTRKKMEPRSIKATAGEEYGMGPPNLHLAAYRDDVAYMIHCLQNGAGFDDTRGPQQSTPIHTACFHKSDKFLEAAIETGMVNPWIRDACDRLPFDIASAFNNRFAMTLLFDLMYNGPRGPRPPGRVLQFPSP